MLADRMSLFPASGTAGARAAAKAATAGGRQVFDLSAGEVICEPAGGAVAGAIAALERGENRYTDTIGIAPLREAIARRLSSETGQVWSADEVAVTAGAKQGLFNAVMAVLNPGDEVLIPVPYWTTFPAQVLLAGAQPMRVDTRANGYLPRIEDLRAALTPATRAIIINTPNNPTGAVYDRALLGDIAEFAIQARLWVVFDECYSSFVWEPLRHHNIVSVVPEVRSRTLVVNAFSKQLALTGWRLGYVAGPPAVIAAVKALQGHTTSNPNVIAQHGVLAHLLQEVDTGFERGLHHRLHQARSAGLEILAGLERELVPTAQGGFYFYLDLARLLAAKPRAGIIADADDVARVLLEEAGVAGVSGTAFGDPSGLRLSYGAPVEILLPALRRVVGALNGMTRPERIRVVA